MALCCFPRSNIKRPRDLSDDNHFDADGDLASIASSVENQYDNDMDHYCYQARELKSVVLDVLVCVNGKNTNNEASRNTKKKKGAANTPRSQSQASNHDDEYNNNSDKEEEEEVLEFACLKSVKTLDISVATPTGENKDTKALELEGKAGTAELSTFALALTSDCLTNESYDIYKLIRRHVIWQCLTLHQYDGIIGNNSLLYNQKVKGQKNVTRLEASRQIRNLLKEKVGSKKKVASLKLTLSIGIIGKQDTAIKPLEYDLNDDDDEINNNMHFSQEIMVSKEKTKPGLSRSIKSANNLQRSSHSMQRSCNEFMKQLYANDHHDNEYYYHGFTAETMDAISQDWVHDSSTKEAIFKQYDLDADEFPTIEDCPSLSTFSYIKLLGTIHNKVKRAKYPPGDNGDPPSFPTANRNGGSTIADALMALAAAQTTVPVPVMNLSQQQCTHRAIVFTKKTELDGNNTMITKRTLFVGVDVNLNDMVRDAMRTLQGKDEEFFVTTNNNDEPTNNDITFTCDIGNDDEPLSISYGYNSDITLEFLFGMAGPSKKVLEFKYTCNAEDRLLQL